MKHGIIEYAFYRSWVYWGRIRAFEGGGEPPPPEQSGVVWDVEAGAPEWDVEAGAPVVNDV